MSTGTSKPWKFPMPPRTADEQARWDVEDQRRRDRQASMVTGVTAADMPGPCALAVLVAGAAVCGWLGRGA
jgi:hypothetical protein